ncbi:zinc finger protein 58-like [Plodia interpunctella]|uniref:zinc finger protein 58-like n=1 Tax=Plodia interpunctella TaxID=58824 RepID=UPI002368A728|nr:zinc finger protein 58-like [Plodia interpunctella]
MWSVLVTDDTSDSRADGSAVCVGCLATGVTLHDMHANNLAESFMEITGVTIASPAPLCVYCRARLRSSSLFRRRARRAHHALHNALSPEYLRELGQKLKHQYACAEITTLNLTDTNEEVEIKREESSSDSDDYLLSTLGSSKKLEKEEVDSDKDLNTNDVDSDGEVECLPVFAENVKKEVKKKRVKIKKERGAKKCKTDDEIKRDVNGFNFDVVFLSRDEQLQEVAELKNREIKYTKNDTKCELCGKNFKTKRSREVHFKKYHDASVGSFECDICHSRFKAKNRMNTHMKIHRERFHCRNCDFVTNRECGLRLHYEYHQGKKYICEYCKKDFAKVSSYMSHVRLIHASLLPWCELCGESFIGEKGVQAHKKRAHKDFEDLAFKCVECKMCFVNEKALDKHTSLNKCSLSNCVHCGDAFASLQLLKYHLVQRHGTESAVTTDCDACAVSFHSNAAYQRHVTACGASAVCVQCGEHFRDHAALSAHEAGEHTALNFFKCEECSRTFTNAYYFRDHCARGHERARRPLAGEHKDKLDKLPRKRGRKRDGSASASAMRAWRVLDERRLVMRKLAPGGELVSDVRVRDAVCEVCGKAFANVSLLKLHQRLHTGEKLFTCTYCNKKFNVSTLLRNHMRVHTGERPYACAECPKAFKEWAGYKRHLLSHSGVRKHICELCQKSFLTSTCVKVHIRSVHMKIPMPPRVRKPRLKHP